MSLEHEKPELLDVVALLEDVSEAGLTRGQVGTIVEKLGHDAVLVEFSDDAGRAYAITPCPLSNLLVLRYEKEPA
jgi:hypothetical protein